MVTALISTGALGQTKVGPKVGVNYYGMDVNKRGDNRDRPFMVGFNFGVAASFAISDRVSIAPEIIFTQKGERAEGRVTQNFPNGSSIVQAKESFRLNYLEMPTLMRVAFGSTMKWYVNVGHSIGYWLGGNFTPGEGAKKLKIRFVPESEVDALSSDEAAITEEESNRYEVGVVLGGGLTLSTGMGDLLIDLRYQKGLSKFGDATIDKEYYTAKNHGFAVSVIYLLGSK